MTAEDQQLRLPNDHWFARDGLGDEKDISIRWSHESDQLSFVTDGGRWSMSLGDFVKDHAGRLALEYDYDFGKLVMLVHEHTSSKECAFWHKQLDRICRMLWDAVPKNSVPVKWSNLSESDRKAYADRLGSMWIRGIEKKPQLIELLGGKDSVRTMLVTSRCFYMTTVEPKVSLTTTRSGRTYNGPLSISFSGQKNVDHIVVTTDACASLQVLFTDLPDVWQEAINEYARWLMPPREDALVEVQKLLEAKEDAKGPPSLGVFRRALAELKKTQSNADRDHIMRQLCFDLECIKDDRERARLQEVMRSLKRLGVSNKELQMLVSVSP